MMLYRKQLSMKGKHSEAHNGWKERGRQGHSILNVSILWWHTGRRLCRLGLGNLASLEVGGFKQRKKEAHPLHSSLWAMVKTWLRVNMKAMAGVMAVVRLEGGREGGGNKEIGSLWEQTVTQTRWQFKYKISTTRAEGTGDAGRWL